MRPLLFRIASVFFSVLLAAAPAHAQQDPDQLGDVLNNIGQDYADNYTQPITDALGAGMNSGLFRTAEVGGGGIVPAIDVYVGVAAMGTFTGGSASTFTLDDERIPANSETGQSRTLIVEYPNRDLPTAFGPDESPGTAVLRDAETGQQVGEVDLPPSLINTSIAPLLVPQVGVGTVLGTDAQLRYFPETDISNYGSVGLFGLSVRHSLSQYIPLSPVSIAVQGTYQTLSLSGEQQDDIVDASGWALNAQVSKSVPVAPITFYGGLQYEQFGVDVDYTFQSSAGTTQIQFEQDAQNSVRALAGVSVTLAVVQLNVDYAVGANNVVTAGLGITL